MRWNAQQATWVNVWPVLGCYWSSDCDMVRGEDIALTPRLLHHSQGDGLAGGCSKGFGARWASEDARVASMRGEIL